MFKFLSCTVSVDRKTIFVHYSMDNLKGTVSMDALCHRECSTDTLPLFFQLLYCTFSSHIDLDSDTLDEDLIDINWEQSFEDTKKYFANSDMSYSRHLYRGSPYETSSDCGNCDGAGCCDYDDDDDLSAHCYPQWRFQNGAYFKDKEKMLAYKAMLEDTLKLI